MTVETQTDYIDDLTRHDAWRVGVSSEFVLSLHISGSLHIHQRTCEHGEIGREWGEREREREREGERGERERTKENRPYERKRETRKKQRPNVSEVVL